MNIKLFAFAKGSASVPILAVCGDKINEDALKAEATKVLIPSNRRSYRSSDPSISVHRSARRSILAMGAGSASGTTRTSTT